MPSAEGRASTEGAELERDASGESGSAALDAPALGLPTDPDAIVRYLAHRYRGVGEKTAESLVERFGADLFRVLRDDPAAIAAAVSPKRAEQVLEAWGLDYQRRLARVSGDGGGSSSGGRRGGDDRGERQRGGSRDRDDR